MVEEMLAARGISVTHETIRQWGLKFGREFANRIRRRAPRVGDKWHLDEVVISFAAKKHWLWRAVDQDGFVLDVLVQSRRDKEAAKRLFRKLLKKQGRAPRVLAPYTRQSRPVAESEMPEPRGVVGHRQLGICGLYPGIAAAVSSLPARQAYLDGELCGVQPDGSTSLQPDSERVRHGKRRGVCLLPVRPPPSRRRGHQPEAGQRAEGAPSGASVDRKLAFAIQRSPDRTRPDLL
jgi:hypothetical protein